MLEATFKENKKWGKRDRQFVAETVYDCVRWRALYEYLQKKINNKSISLVDIHLAWHDKPLPDWTLVNICKKDLENLIQEAPEWVTLSYPEWLHQKALQDIGAETWIPCAKALNEQAQVVLRVNTLKSTRQAAATALAQEDFQTDSLSFPPDALILQKRGNIFRTQSFQNGFFEVQDTNSQRVGLLLNPQPGERVIDACAGAGGKSLHIAALMQNKGKLISLDIYSSKLEELRRRARRASAQIIETRWIENTKVIKRLQDSADALLLDVPCSGLGVLKRNPDSKWKITPQKIEDLNKTQKEILQSYSRMVKPGGRMVYATCSILPSENHLQVEEFLKNNSQWTKVSEETLWPHITGFDGFYLCLLKRSL